MPDEKGFKLIVKINLPPAAQYASGHSIIVQENTAAALKKILDSLTGVEGHGELILAAFAEHAVMKAVEVKVQPDAQTAAEQVAPAEPARDAKADNEGRAVKGSGTEQASKALKSVAVKKAGVTLEELEGKSTDEVKAIIAAAKTKGA